MLRILLPPSEGKSDAAGTARLESSYPNVAADAQALFRKLDRMTLTERSRWYGIRNDAKLKAAHALNKTAVAGDGIAAIQRYSGVVYQHIDYASLTQKRRARSRVYVVSALFGLIPGRAPIHDYKLSMTPDLARLWLSINHDRLDADTKPRDEWLVLLSQSYAKAVPGDCGTAVGFRVEGGRKAAGHFGKAIKGRFVRWLVENKIDSLADIGAFDEDGYRFDGVNFVQD